MCVGAHRVNPKIVVTIISGSVRAVQVSPMAFHCQWQPLDIGGHCFRCNRTICVKTRISGILYPIIHDPVKNDVRSHDHDFGPGTCSQFARVLPSHHMLPSR